MAKKSLLYSPRISKPGISPTEPPIDWLEDSSIIELDITAPATGSAMERNDSAYYGSEDSYSHKHSPAPTAYGAESLGCYNPNDLSVQQYQQLHYNDAHPSLTRSSASRSYHARPTPKSLGWTEADLVHYKFVIPKGRESYWELVDKSCWDNRPDRIFLDSKDSRKNEFPCMFPGCDATKPFKRPADLERHYRNVHGSEDQKDNFFCDYTPCKSRGAFTRKDHFRDHLRDYHKEDIGSTEKSDRKNPQKQWSELQAAWVAERKIEAKWWRCPKCLERIHIAESAYDCQNCKLPCEIERMERIEDARSVKFKTLSGASTSSASTAMDAVYGYTAQTTGVPTITYPGGHCADCVGTGFSPGSFESCLSCQPQADQYYNADPHWDTGSFGDTSRYR